MILTRNNIIHRAVIYNYNNKRHQIKISRSKKENQRKKARTTAQLQIFDYDDGGDNTNDEWDKDKISK